MQMLRKVLGIQKADVREKQYRDLIRREAKIGGQLFGEVPAGHRREFFCLDEHTWVWHEEWINSAGTKQIRNTQYSVRPQGVVKMHNGSNSYHSLSPSEARNFHDAVRKYYSRVTKTLYA
jgi:hypothetical protein